MKKSLVFLAMLLIVSVASINANYQYSKAIANLNTMTDSIRLAELNDYWTQLSKTVREGDFKAYGALYHSDAVVVFAGGSDKISVSISEALSNWEQGFNDTKEGKQNDNVEFRFSQRIGNETTAHETGIFAFTSIDNNGNVKRKTFTHFEMLLVKRDNEWYSLMEYQKPAASQEQWDALK